MLEYKVIYRGYGQVFGILSIFLIFISIILAGIIFLLPVNGLISLFLLILFTILFSLSIFLFVYSYTLKRIVLDEYGIRYWFGRKLKFHAYWPEILKLTNGVTGGRVPVVYIYIETVHDRTSFCVGIHFNENIIKKVFYTMAVILSGLKHVEIHDTLGWYPERKLISKLLESFYTNSTHRLSVTLMM